MKELEPELKKDCGRKPRKSHNTSSSSRNSGNTSSRPFFVCPNCGLEDTDAERHRNHVQECREHTRVKKISTGPRYTRTREHNFSEVTG